MIIVPFWWSGFKSDRLLLWSPYCVHLWCEIFACFLLRVLELTCDQREVLRPRPLWQGWFGGPATERYAASIIFCDNKCKFTLQLIDRMLTYKKIKGFLLQLISLIHDFDTQYSDKDDKPKWRDLSTLLSSLCWLDMMVAYGSCDCRAVASSGSQQWHGRRHLADFRSKGQKGVN